MENSCISVVVPARNEAKKLPRLLDRLHDIPEVGEILVADGGSTDATIEWARRGGAQVVQGAHGRGPQQNLGATQTTGEILWFLHADSLPSRHTGHQILHAVRGGALGGNVRMRFDAPGLAPRFFEGIARQQRKLGIYYGDSGLWVTKSTWLQLGGFAPWHLFEDYHFVRRLERLGPTVCCPGRLLVSARRFEKRPWRTLALWLELQARFHLGQSPEQLAHLYRARSV